MEAGAESQLTETQRLGKRAVGERTVLALALPLAAGLALRAWMLHCLFLVDGDSLIYGGLARNLLLHGQYGLTVDSGEIYPTLIRLPGYRSSGCPLFPAVRDGELLFGGVRADCAGSAELPAAGRLRAAHGEPARRADRRTGGTLAWRAVPVHRLLCIAEPLTEAPTFFVLALAMWAMARFRGEPNWVNALYFTLADHTPRCCGRDGALAAIAFAPALVIGSRARRPARRRSRWEAGAHGGICALLALAPFAVWTARQWSVFHVFEPLAPRLAMDPGKSPNPGWERWVKSWCLDFKSTYEIYLECPGRTNWT